MNEIMHCSRVIRFFSVNAQKNFSRAIGIRSGDLISWCRSEVGQRVERSRFRIVGKGVVELFHRRFPPSDAQPVILRSWIEKESFRRPNEKLFALCRRLKRLRFLHHIPSLLQRGGAWPCRPERLKERHRLAPISHRATRIDHLHVLECFTRLRVSHVMEQRDCVREFILRWL